jgi:hypothetical protein
MQLPKWVSSRYVVTATKVRKQFLGLYHGKKSVLQNRIWMFGTRSGSLGPDLDLRAMKLTFFLARLG